MMKVKIIKVEAYPNCAKYTIEAKTGKNVLRERFSFSKEQVKSGVWKNIVKEWVEGHSSGPAEHPVEGQEVEL